MSIDESRKEMDEIFGKPEPWRGAEVHQPKRPVFSLTWDDHLDDIVKHEWLLSSILPEASFSVIFGAPGVGKSFIALDWSFSIAHGKSWYGHNARVGDVIYVCGEGWSGIRDRVAAWKISRGLLQMDRSGVAFHNRALRLLDTNHVEAFAEALLEDEVSPALIVIDTLARNAVGVDENSARDMGQVVSSCDLLRETFNCSVLIVHHSNKGGQGITPGLRGSSALQGAADMIAKVVAGKEEGVLTLSCDKQKEAQRFAPLTFKLTPYGNSCVPMPLDRTTTHRRLQQEEMPFHGNMKDEPAPSVPAFA